MRFYTYIHATPEGDVFYVGKGTGRRVYSMGDRSWLWREKFNSLDGITMKIVARFPTEREAFEHEKQLVSQYKSQGYCLVNQCDGGSGPSGYKVTEDRKAKLSKIMKGYKHQIVTCPHCGDKGGETSMKRWHFDNCKGPAKKFKARVTLNGERICLGRFLTKEEAKAAEEDFYKSNPRPANIWLGRKHTEESREKMRRAQAGHDGRPWSDDQRKKMSDMRKGESNPFFGRKHSQETIDQISETNKGRTGYWTGKKFSESHLANLRVKRICPHCDKEGSGSAMNRYHMDNCKFKAEAA